MVFFSVGFSPADHRAEQQATAAVQTAAAAGLARPDRFAPGLVAQLLPAELSFDSRHAVGEFLLDPDVQAGQRHAAGPAPHGPHGAVVPCHAVAEDLVEPQRAVDVLAHPRRQSPGVGEPLFDMLDQNMANLAANAGPYQEDSATMATATSYDCVGRGQEICDLPWICHNYWLQYRYSMDDGRLRRGLFPLLKRSVNYYLHQLKPGADGKLHIAAGSSPEYPVNPSPIRTATSTSPSCGGAAETLLVICERLHIDDPLIPRWRETLEKLTAYPTDANGLMISAGVPLAESHRHYSHLLAIHPLHLLRWDQAEQRDIILRSVDHWTSMTSAWKGYSMSGAASMYALMGRGDEALKVSEHDAGEGTDAEHALYLLRSLSGGVVCRRGISQEMLLQSWGGKIRVFPAVPEGWKNVAFHDLRAEGAFLVSAVRKEGKTQCIRIKSLAGEPCQLETAEGVKELRLSKGEETILGDGDRTIAPVSAQADGCNSFGLRGGPP